MNIKTKRKQQIQKHSLRSNVGIALLAVITIALCGAQVFLAGRVATHGNQIKNLEVERAQLNEDIATLRGELAEMSSLSKIEQRAITDLHMVSGSSDIVYISTQASVESLAAHN